MMLLHGIHGMPPSEPSALEYLSGIGTLVLGIATIVLGILNYRLSTMVREESRRASEKDRKVHLADKRMEWIVEFRDTVSEILSLAYMAAPPRAENANDLLTRFLTLKNKLELLEPGPDGFDWDIMERASVELKEIENYLTGDAILDKYESARRRLMEKSKSAIREKWKKIKNLDA